MPRHVQGKRSTLASPLLIFSTALLILGLSACAGMAPRNQAEYQGYSYDTVFKDVTDAKCKYGPYTWGGIGLWDGTVFKNLTCTWKSKDGTPRSETVDMKEVLNPKIVKWHFTDAEVHHTQPFAFDPNVEVELRDKLFRVSVKAMVQYYGEYLSNGGRRIPYRTVTNTLIERSGQ